MTDLLRYRPLIRIALRYAAGMLAGFPVLARLLLDLEGDAVALEMILSALGVAIGLVVEWAYARARRDGGPT